MTYYNEFYVTEVTILSVTESGGYSKAKQTTELGTMMVDLQPVSGPMVSKDYGLDFDIQFKMFSDNSDWLVNNNFVKYDNKLYKIVKVAKWPIGTMCLLKEDIEDDD